MVKIRLMRVGKKKQPSFRVVVADSRSPRDGRIIESIGNYQPRLEPSGIAIDNERAIYWLERGAQPSEQVKKLLQLTGAWTEFSGEPAPTQMRQAAGPEAAKAKATPAAEAAPAKSVKATPAASVEETGAEDETPVEVADETKPAEPTDSEQREGL